MEDISRRHTLKLLSTIIGAATLPGCECLAGRDSNCANYQFDEITYPVIDMHAHFFNATDLMVAEYLTGPALNDEVGDRFRVFRLLLLRIANATLKIAEVVKRDIKATSELAWLRTDEACKTTREYAVVSNLFFDVITEEDRQKMKLFNGERAEIPFQDLLNQAAANYRDLRNKGIQVSQSDTLTIKFDKDTLLRAVTGEPLAEGMESIAACPSDPGTFRRYLAFAARALVRRSTNVQAYYDRYSLNPIDGVGVKYVMNIGCDFDFFLGCREVTSSIADQIKVNEEIWRHTAGFAIPILGVNPWKMYHDDEYAKLVDSTLSRGIYKGVKLYPSIGYSVTGDIRDGVRSRQCRGLGVSETIVREGMNKLIESVSKHNAYITSHTTFSKGAEPGAEALSSWEYWQDRLRVHPDLRVNFGHMGDPGEKGTAAWRKGFLNLMSQYENVYADFGYHEYDDAEILKANLMKFKDDHGEAIFNKITYGSDWYMISKDEGSNAYLCSATNSFNQAVSEGVISKDQMKNMFFNNANRFLKMNI